MSTIVTRAAKGSPLTHNEVDANFTNLNTDKYQSGDVVTFASAVVTGAATLNGTSIPNNKTLLVTTDIGTSVQAYDADLTAFAGKTAPTGDVVGTSDSQTLTNKTINGTNNTITNVSLTTAVTGTLPIANGGTNGTASPTNGGVAYGTGSAYAFTSAGTLGQYLKSNGAGAPTWENVTASAVIDTTTTPPTVPAGSLWWDSDVGIDYIYYNDGSNTRWINFSGSAKAEFLFDGGSAVTTGWNSISIINGGEA